MLLEEALAAVGVSPQIAVETAAREAIVPLVLAGAGAALLPARLADEATRRGAVSRRARPAITRKVGSHPPSGAPLGSGPRIPRTRYDRDRPGASLKPRARADEGARSLDRLIRSANHDENHGDDERDLSDRHASRQI